MGYQLSANRQSNEILGLRLSQGHQISILAARCRTHQREFNGVYLILLCKDLFSAVLVAIC